MANTMNLILNRDIIERKISHIWYNAEDKSNVIWTGCILGRDDKSSGDPLLTVKYWDSNSTDDSELTPMSVFQLATDYFCGDLEFLDLFEEETD